MRLVSTLLESASTVIIKDTNGRPAHGVEDHETSITVYCYSLQDEISLSRPRYDTPVDLYFVLQYGKKRGIWKTKEDGNLIALHLVGNFSKDPKSWAGYKGWQAFTKSWQFKPFKEN